MRKALILAGLVSLAFGAWALPPFAPPAIVGTVVSVVDEITAEVQIESLPTPAPAGLSLGKVERVRYIGLALQGEASDAQAKELASLLFQGRKVYLELDEKTRDEAGRLLAYVYLDPQGLVLANAVLLATGLYAYSPISGAERYKTVLAHADATPSPAPGFVCPKTYSWDAARAKLGETACVEGKVASVGTSRGGDVFLNLGRPYPDPERFTVFIPSRCVGRFEAKFGPRFWTTLQGASIRALGKITEYQGGPEIELCDPGNLVIF